MLSDALLADIRSVGAIVLGLILLWWTYERAFKSESRDPVLRMSSSSTGGSASVLLSGTSAVASVAIGVAVLLLAPIGGGPLVEEPLPLLLSLGLLSVAHWAIETNEVES